MWTCMGKCADATICTLLYYRTRVGAVLCVQHGEPGEGADQGVPQDPRKLEAAHGELYGVCLSTILLPPRLS